MVCEECKSIVPETGSLVNSDHTDGCSLNPANISN